VLSGGCVLQENVELRPMFGASDAADSAAASDSGGASFLGQLWDALQVGGEQREGDCLHRAQHCGQPDARGCCTGSCWMLCIGEKVASGHPEQLGCDPLSH